MHNSSEQGPVRSRLRSPLRVGHLLAIYRLFRRLRTTEQSSQSTPHALSRNATRTTHGGRQFRSIPSLPSPSSSHRALSSILRGSLHTQPGQRPVSPSLGGTSTVLESHLSAITFAARRPMAIGICVHHRLNGRMAFLEPEALGTTAAAM